MFFFYFSGSVPFYLKPFVFPIVCIVPILLLLTLLALLLNFQISINPFTGFCLKPHSAQQSRYYKEQEESKHIENPADTVHSSRNQQIPSALESAVAANDTSPLILLNWPAIEKFLHGNQKGNKICKNCQTVMCVPSDGSGDSSQNMSCLDIKKNSNDFTQKNCEHKQLKDSETSMKQHTTCLGDCCIHYKANTLLSEGSNSVPEQTGEEAEKDVIQIKNLENKHLGVSSCQCKSSNETINKESCSISEKLKECT